MGKIRFLSFRVNFRPLTRMRVKNDARPGMRNNKIIETAQQEINTMTIQQK